MAPSRRHRWWTPIMLSALAFSASAYPFPSAAAPVAPIRVSAEIDIPCATTTLRHEADWYFPVEQPRGLVVLLHGFGAGKGQYRELATALAADGELVVIPTLQAVDPRGCAVSSLIPNTAYLGSLAEVFTDSDALRRAFTEAATRAGRTELQLPEHLVLIGHSAGADVALGAAAQLVGNHPDTFGRLSGLILLDPVPGLDRTATGRALAALAPTGLPLRTIATPPSLCNNGPDGVLALRRALPGRSLGIELSTGSHVDALGTDDAGVAMAAGLLCGQITEPNAAITRSFTTAWTRDELTATPSPEFYPGGGYYEELIHTGAIRPL
ncbi:alpha/beta hydrolase [Nocardia sp. NPDC050712]|uniref:alpha/beta hydrolase n=1 Tax=Nocardia sp. NPDC050712 TaxID=3155518 RepID=UPI0033F3ED9E